MASDNSTDKKRIILIVYHSQGGTMKAMAEAVAQGALEIENTTTVLKTAQEATIDDLLGCHGIAVGSPEYFGYMSGAIKDFFDRTYEMGHECTHRLPYFLFVCAGNDGRGAVASMERIITGYRWKKIADPVRILKPNTAEMEHLAELGQTLAAGVEAGIF